MGDVIVVTGPPGAGKSTVAEQLADLLHPSALVTGDDFFGFLRNGAISPWRAEAHEQNIAVTEAAAAASGRMAGHCHVVYDGVVGPWFIEIFSAAARPDGRLHYALLLPPLDVCLDRVSGRQGHGFTDLGAARNMWQAFAGAAIDRRHLLVNHPQLPSEAAHTVLEMVQSGTIRYP